MLLCQILAPSIDEKILNCHIETINLKHQLLPRTYVSDTQDYFKYIIKKHERLTDKAPVRIYINKIENRITFKI